MGLLWHPLCSKARLAQRHSLHTDLRLITVAGSEESGSAGPSYKVERPVRNPLEKLWWKFRMRVA